MVGAQDGGAAVDGINLCSGEGPTHRTHRRAELVEPADPADLLAWLRRCAVEPLELRVDRGFNIVVWEHASECAAEKIG